MPVFQRDGSWFFRCLDDSLAGPYSSREMAELKYQEYTAYVVTAPGCHHK